MDIFSILHFSYENIVDTGENDVIPERNENVYTVRVYHILYRRI